MIVHFESIVFYEIKIKNNFPCGKKNQIHSLLQY